MTDTGFFVPLAEQHRFAAMIGARDPADVTASRSLKLAAAGRFDWTSNPETDLEYRPHRAFRGGHGLVSTAADYLRFCAMLLGGGTLGGARILGRQTVELMTGNRLPAALLPFEVNGREQHGYGYGLGVRVLLDPRRRPPPGLGRGVRLGRSRQPPTSGSIRSRSRSPSSWRRSGRRATSAWPRSSANSPTKHWSRRRQSNGRWTAAAGAAVSARCALGRSHSSPRGGRRYRRALGRRIGPFRRREPTAWRGSRRTPAPASPSRRRRPPSGTPAR